MSQNKRNRFRRTIQMVFQRLLPALAVAGLYAFTAPAYAADVTAAQASDLESQLRGWMAGLVSPALDVGPRPVLITADGDHFNVELPAPDIVAAAGIAAPGLSLKLKAKPLDSGRWALDDLTVPLPLKLTAPKGTGPDVNGDQSMTITAESQQFHGIFDPSYATTSSFDSIVTGMKVAGASSVSTTARATSHSIWQPAGDGRINVLTESMSEKSSNKITNDKGQDITYSVEKSASSAQFKSMAPASLATLIRSIAALVPTLPGTADSLSPAQRTLARNAVFAIQDMIAGVEATSKMEGIKFTAEGHTGSIARASFATKGGIDDGKIQAVNEIAVEGFDSPEIPKGVYRDYLPRKISLKPRVSGVPRDDLIKLLLRAIDSEAKDLPELQEAAIALLGAGPLEIAIDDLAIDLGKASLSGNGSLDIAGLNDITGEAEISVKGLDALIKTANTKPDLKQIAPVLIFIKGIGKQDGDATVWNIAYQDNNITVNDTDLSALMPGGGGPGKK
jgi:hypothetical protein